MKSIAFFDYQRLFECDKEELIRIILGVGSKGAFIMQKDLRDFEQNLSRFCESNFAVGVGNATDGLELAWLAVGLKPGDEVIISSHTMVATASAIVTAGGIPVPVDIGDDYLIDPNAIESAITKRTVGISPTHLNGRTCDMQKIISISQKYGLAVIEDAAQALGSKFRGKLAGTFGVAGSISFFPAKVLGGLGDGGAVITNSSEIFHKIYQLHDHGRDTDGEIKSWGRNSRLDNLQAAILNYKLRNYGEVIARRRNLANLYNERLADIEFLGLPPAPNNGDHFDVFQNYEITAERRDELRQHLTSNGIGTLVQWGGKAVHQFEALGFNINLPRVEKFFTECLMLPMNMFISDDDVEYICESIHSFYTK